MKNKKIDQKLIEKVRKFYETLRQDTKNKWARDLPFEELLFDRWEHAKQLGFGKGSSIYHSSHVYGDVKVGKDTWIGPFTVLDGSGKLVIGSHCSISAGVQIYSHDSVKWALSKKKKSYEKKPVKIGSHCYIGPQTVIVKGISIGNHVLVGANSLVNKNLPSYSIAFGSPAKIVGKVKFDKKGNISFEYFSKEKLPK